MFYPYAFAVSTDFHLLDEVISYELFLYSNYHNLLEKLYSPKLKHNLFQNHINLLSFESDFHLRSAYYHPQKSTINAKV